MPGLYELRTGERLVIDYESNDCLIGPRRWIIEFSGSSPVSLRIRTVGHRVVPRKETVDLDEMQVAQINELLRNLPSYASVGCTSGVNIKVSLRRGGEISSDWEFEGVIPRNEHLEAHVILYKLCRLVEHEYRKPDLRDKLGSAFFAVGFVVLVAIGLLIRALWIAISHLFRWVTH